MTIERAKQIAKQVSMGYVCILREGEAEEYNKMFLSLLCKEQKNNAPLTPDELRQMDGEPYYHVGLQPDSPAPHWAVLDPFVARCPEDYGYGKRWLAYRHKQGEG